MTELLAHLIDLAECDAQRTFQKVAWDNRDAILAMGRERDAAVAANYKSFTDGLEAGAEICGSLAETTYDDSDAFEAATGCEAAIMRVVKQQRAEQGQALEGGNQ